MREVKRCPRRALYLLSDTKLVIIFSVVSVMVRRGGL